MLATVFPLLFEFSIMDLNTAQVCLAYFLPIEVNAIKSFRIVLIKLLLQLESNALQIPIVLARYNHFQDKVMPMLLLLKIT